jgi:hypothetical protein
MSACRYSEGVKFMAKLKDKKGEAIPVTDTGRP